MGELTDAIRAGDASAVAAILQRDPSSVHANEGGVTPLLFALYNGKPDVAQMLIDRGAPVSFGEACALGDRRRVEEMLESDPSLINRRTGDGFPPLGLAIFFRHPAIAQLLIEQGADVNAAADNAQRVSPLHAAAAVRDHSTMRLLLGRGADPNAKQQMDYTPLHGAASRGDTEMAAMLLEHGADPTVVATDGLAPAAVARKYGHPEFAEWLEGRVRS